MVEIIKFDTLNRTGQTGISAWLECVDFGLAQICLQIASLINEQRVISIFF